MQSTWLDSLRELLIAVVTAMRNKADWEDKVVQGDRTGCKGGNHCRLGSGRLMNPGDKSDTFDHTCSIGTRPQRPFSVQ